MELTPKNIFKGKNSDGSTFRVEEWDYFTLANLEMIGWICTLIAIALVGAFISPILMILCLFNFTGRAKLLHLIGIIISAYFLYDCYSGWLGLAILRIFLEDTTLNIIVAINCAALLCHTVILFFGIIIYNEAAKLKNAFLLPILVVLVIGFIGLSYGFSITKKHKNWATKNSRSDEEPKVETRSFEQIEKDSQREYEEQLIKEGRNPEDMKRWEN